MRVPTESYLKVAYDLRPAKQVERRMIIDALQRMAIEGFPIRDYRYVGFGSFYFVDFIMIHKLLGLSKLTSVEYSRKIKKRVAFNRPFRLIDLIFSPIGDVISNLTNDEKHILWLDYDCLINMDVISDIASAAARLAPGSVLLVTVDSEPPLDDREPKASQEWFSETVGEYLKPTWGLEDFTRTRLPLINGDIILNSIASGLTGRKEIGYLPIFNFLYADGHKMLTLGGVIGSSTEERKLRSCNFAETPYVRTRLGDDPYTIKIPRLTRKERLYLDSAMPCDDNWQPRDFEMNPDDVRTYREIYRYYPSYSELLLG